MYVDYIITSLVSNFKSRGFKTKVGLFKTCQVLIPGDMIHGDLIPMDLIPGDAAMLTIPSVLIGDGRGCSAETGLSIFDMVLVRSWELE